MTERLYEIYTDEMEMAMKIMIIWGDVTPLHTAVISVCTDPMVEMMIHLNTEIVNMTASLSW